jgi:DNA-3-methyladenine glycosylase
MYFCLNITTGRVPGKPEAVLVRALEPIAGIEIMAKRRRIPKRRIYDLTGGPGKLCMAMGISKKQNDADLCTSRLHIEKMARIDERSIVQTRRVNVDYADEWKNRPWRFFMKNNSFVSRQTGR